MIYVVCRFWPDQNVSFRRRLPVATRRSARVRQPVSPVLVTSVLNVTVPPELPKAA